MSNSLPRDARGRFLPRIANARAADILAADRNFIASLDGDYWQAPPSGRFAGVMRKLRIAAFFGLAMTAVATVATVALDSRDAWPLPPAAPEVAEIVPDTTWHFDPAAPRSDIADPYVLAVVISSPALDDVAVVDSGMTLEECTIAKSAMHPTVWHHADVSISLACMSEIPD
jgi:hypothetical protein